MTTEPTNEPSLGLALPKGRMQAAVFQLFEDAGLPVMLGERDYRPRLPAGDFDAKLMKPQNIVEMLIAGSRDIGFCGADWVRELEGDLVEVLDTELNPVRIVAAAPSQILEGGALPSRPLVVASEYENLTRTWITERGIDARFLKSFGATEAFPPEDADCIVDNTSTGATLRANDLEIFDELMKSSTRLFANPAAIEDPSRRERIEELVMLLRSVLDARRRVMLELNVDASALDAVVRSLPCMREPTIAQLHEGKGFAVRAAVPKDVLPSVIPVIKSAGGTDIVVTKLDQIIA